MTRFPSRLPSTATAAACVLALGLAACGGDAPTVSAQPPSVPAAAERGATVLTGMIPRINGQREDLASYRGKVVLVVNTASKCGFTPQFDALEKLYADRRAEGLVVLGFPSGDFRQELGKDAEVDKFCRLNYGVTFPMFRRSKVTGPAANVLFARLNTRLGPPAWNFTKYVLDRQGRPVATFESAVEPTDPALTGVLTALLAEDAAG